MQPGAKAPALSESYRVSDGEQCCVPSLPGAPRLGSLTASGQKSLVGSTGTAAHPCCVQKELLKSNRSGSIAIIQGGQNGPKLMVTDNGFLIWTSGGHLCASLF